MFVAVGLEFVGRLGWAGLGLLGFWIACAGLVVWFVVSLLFGVVPSLICVGVPCVPFHVYCNVL